MSVFFEEYQAIRKQLLDLAIEFPDFDELMENHEEEYDELTEQLTELWYKLDKEERDELLKKEEN